MSTAHGSGHRDGSHHPEEPGLDPALDPLIRALTASGHPHERGGRDAALAAFRAASQQQRAGLATETRAPRVRRPGPHGYPGRPRRPLRLLLPARVAAVCAAGFTVLGGVTAAAYAQVLPAPVQQVAHSVLAPLGVPDSKQNSGGPSALSSGTASSAGASSGAASSAAASSPASAAAGPTSITSVSVTTSPSPSASGQASPSGSASGGAPYVITLTAVHAHVPYGTPDLFTAQLTQLGQPAAATRVRLLERVTGSASWQVVASGVTGKRGGVALSDPSLTTTAAFRLGLPGGVRSAAVRVTVGPGIRLRLAAGPLKDKLIVAAPAGSPSEPVDLMQLVGGVWETVASKPLGPALRAVFALPVSSAAGYLYRAQLAGTAGSTATAPLSNRVWIPRKPGTGATGVQPTATQSPAPAPTTTAVTTPPPTTSPSPPTTPTSAPPPTTPATP